MKYVGVAALLGTACVAWSAFPLRSTGAPGALILVVAVVCVLAGLVRLALKDTSRQEGSLFGGAAQAVVSYGHAALLRVPWETGAALAVVVLETLHRAAPWHTALLGTAVVSYLLAVHQAESAVPRGVFRGQAKALMAGLGLLAIITGVAMVPAARAGAVPAWLEMGAAVAAMVAGALALPV